MKAGHQQLLTIKLLVTSLFQLIETVLNIKLPDDLLGALRDGVILCHLANHMRPHSVTSIHVPSSAVVSLHLFLVP
jgi:hypothetical protein